jgi:hypothetical protein
MPHTLSMVYITYAKTSVGVGVLDSKMYCEMRLKWREMEGDTYSIEVPLNQAT